jgi:nuclear migration protein JNM1
MLEDGGEEIGDLSDEEDMESLERKIARLKREVEEAKEEYGRKKATAASTPKVDNDELTEEGLASLGEVLESLSLPAGHTRVMAGTITDPTKTAAQSSAAGVALDEPTYTVTYAPSYEQTHALVKTAEFENRLLMLEKAIGATSAALDVDLNGLPRAIVPTLDVLQRQISTLAQASTATLDPISRRVRNLTQEAEQLARARKDAKEQNDQFLSEKEKANKENSSSNEEQDAKINALYGTLATIENLAPLLPPLLDRLRSLRAIHADAAMANETLDRIAKQQMDMATELKQWREGLEKIEGAMKEGNAVMEGNMKVMDSWVKDLEARMVKLS